MRPSDLKFELLEWLYRQYRDNPNGIWDIGPFLKDRGINSESGIIEFGYTLKSHGWLKDYSGCSLNSFNAAISLKGIQVISKDIEKEVHQLLDGLADDELHYFPVLNHLKLLPKVYSVAFDIASYMTSNGWTEMKAEDIDVFIRITKAGIVEVRPNYDKGVVRA